jgi:hypothetical protein
MRLQHVRRNGTKKKEGNLQDAGGLRRIALFTGALAVGTVFGGSMSACKPHNSRPAASAKDVKTGQDEKPATGVYEILKKRSTLTMREGDTLQIGEGDGWRVTKVDEKGIELGGSLRIDYGSKHTVGEFILTTDIEVERGKSPGTVKVTMVKPVMSPPRDK